MADTTKELLRTYLSQVPEEEASKEGFLEFLKTQQAPATETPAPEVNTPPPPPAPAQPNFREMPTGEKVSTVGKYIVRNLEPMRAATTMVGGGMIKPPMQMEAELNEAAKYGWGQTLWDTGMDTALSAASILIPELATLKGAGPATKLLAAGVPTATLDYGLQRLGEELGARPEGFDDTNRNLINIGAATLLPAGAKAVGARIDRARGVPGEENLAELARTRDGFISAKLGGGPSANTDAKRVVADKMREIVPWAEESGAMQRGGRFDSVSGKFKDGSTAPIPMGSKEAARTHAEYIDKAVSAGREEKLGIVQEADKTAKEYVTPLEIKLGKEDTPGLDAMRKDALAASQSKLPEIRAQGQAALEMIDYFEAELNRIASPVDGGIAPSKFEELRLKVQEQARIHEAFNEKLQIAAEHNPSTVAQGALRRGMWQDFLDMTSNWEVDAVSRADPELATRVLNLNKMMHNGMELSKGLKATGAGTDVAFRQDTGNQLMQASTGAPKMPTSKWGAIGAAAQGVANFVVGKPPRFGAELASARQETTTLNDAMRALAYKGGAQPPARTLNIVEPSIRAGKVLLNGAVVQNQNATPAPMKQAGAAIPPRAMTPPPPPPSPTPRVARNVESIETDPVAGVAFEQMAGEDAPYLAKQYAGIHDPIQKGQFWAAIAVNYPEFPFEPGRITGLPSEFSYGDRTYIFDDADKVAWRDKILSSGLREDVQAQFITMLHNDGMVFPLENAGELAQFTPQFSRPDTTNTMLRSQRGPKLDLING